MSGKPVTHDEYLAGVDPAQREALQALRELIRAEAPDATERISYGIPAFAWNGLLVGYGAATQHCSLYVMSTQAMSVLAPRLKGIPHSKGTLRFDPGHPLDPDLVRDIVELRMRENEQRRGK